MRTAALALLLFVPQDRSVDDLIRDLSADSYERQGKAADALVALGPEAVPGLEKLSRTGKAEARAWAERILARIRAQDEKIRPLLEKLASPDDETKEAAEAELLKLGAAAAPWLREAVKSDHKNLQRRAAALLSRLATPAEPKPDANRARAAGGDEHTEAAVERALRWLARHQNENGSWSVTAWTDRCKEPCGPNPGNPEFDPGVTALATLAFLGAGHTPLSKNEFGDVVRKALAWIIEQQDEAGAVGSRRKEKYLYNHLLCALALADAFRLTKSELLKEPAQKAAEFTILAQNPGAGWRYSSRSGDSDSSVTGWAVQSLHAARSAGLKVPKTSLDDAIDWLDDVTDDNYYRVGYTHRGTGKVFIAGVNERFNHHETLTAMGVLSRIYIDRRKDDPRVAGGIALLVRDLPQWDDDDIDFNYWHQATLAIFQYDGPDGKYWAAWNEALKKALVKNQNVDKACSDGSWEPIDRWSSEGGRVYGTAMNALTLETYYRYERVLKK